MTTDYSTKPLLVMCCTLMIVAIASTALRFWSRAVVLKGHYGYGTIVLFQLYRSDIEISTDDWLCLASTIPTVAFMLVGLQILREGIGLHVLEISWSSLHRIIVLFNVASILFTIGLGLTKLSALAFYRRIFGKPGRHNLYSWAIPFSLATFAVFSWMIATLLFTLFRCHRVQDSWTIMGQLTCPNPVNVFLLSMGILHICTEMLVILAPIPQFLRLKLPMRKKILVIFLLVFSYGIPLISIGEVIIISQHWEEMEADFTYSLPPLCYWLLAEPSVSIFAISMPAMFQLLSRARKYGFKSLFTSRDYHLAPGRCGYFLRPPPVLTPPSAGVTASMVEAGTRSSSDLRYSPDLDDGLVEEIDSLQTFDVIRVKTEVVVTYDAKD